ncbi:ATP-binding protein [Streptomyces sp. NPDC005811]|uniref:ATP-binding protein n=1 Tax=Streptomyces sp. NPDC005811 TaxID=3154565 RepID=UPI0033E49675
MSSPPDRLTTPRKPFLAQVAPLDGFTPLYGRQAEQAALIRMTNRLAVGHPGVTVVHGVPGAGRSRLLRRGMSLARVSGVQVLTAVGTAPSPPAPYAFVRQLRSIRSAAGGPALAAEPPTEDSVQGWCRYLLATSRPTLLALDDVQWADPESVQVISGLLRRLASAPLGVLLSVTSADGEFPDACAGLLDQAAAFPDSRGLSLELGPLGVPEFHAMCTAAALPVPEASDGTWWEGVFPLTRGRPWVMLRALDTLRREPALVSAVGLRTALSQQIATADRDRATESAAKLSAGPLALIQGLAVCRGLLPLDRVAALVSLADTELSCAVRTLRVHDLIHPDDPPQLRMTGCTAGLLTGVDGDERKRLHAQAARWAHRCDADEEALAGLLLNTVPLGEPWVPPVLRRASRTLLGRGRHAEAAELLERTLREPLHLAERAEVLLEVAEAYAVIAPEASDRRIAELLSASQVRRQVRAAATDLLLSRGEPHPMLTGSARFRVRYGVGPTGVPPVGSPSRPTDVLRPGPSTAHGAWTAAGPEPGPDTRAALLAVKAWRQTARGHDAAAVREISLEALREPLDEALSPRFTACWALSVADAHDAARDALDVALAEAGRRHSPALVGWGRLLRAQLNLQAGAPDTAVHDLSSCRSLAPAEVWGPRRLPLLRAMEIRLLVARERYAEAGRLAGEELPPGADESGTWIHLLYARAQLYLCQGRPRQALAEAEECGRRTAARGWSNPGLVAWRSLAALAHLGCGDTGRAAELFAEEARLAERWGTGSARAWTDLRRGFGSPAPQTTRLTDRALRGLGPDLASRRFVQAVVAREAAGSRQGRRADSASPAPETQDGGPSRGP